MWKISYFLLLLIACDNCLTYESTGLKEADSIKTNRNYNNRRYQLDEDEANYEDDYNTPEESEEFEGGRLIGRWRNNGEAIEPKWRDGDSIPLVPFEEAATRRKPTPKPKEKLSSNGRDIINHASSTNKYQEMQDEYSKKKHTNTPTSDIKSMPQFVSPSKEIRNYGREELHEPSHHIDYANVPRNGSRRYRTRKQKPLELPAEKAHPAISYEREPVQHTTSHNINPKTVGNIDTGRVRFDTHNYQNPLQIHVHDYELNDEEYHRPRSRKRRPPQNYEYVETKTPYPSLDFWQKSSDSSTTSRTHDTRLQNSPNGGQKQAENSELKSLLKMQQVEGLSLSEILQRRNLTLGDLLKGKIEIINALKSNNDEETSLHAASEQKSIPAKSTTHSRTSSERPKWVTHRRVRIKELRRNPVQVSLPDRNIRKDITDNTNNKINETRELSLLDNEGKSRNNKNFSTDMNQTKPIISPRFNSTRTKPVIITTTTTTTTTIKSTVKDPVMQYDSEKRSTTPQSNDDEEIMEFSDFAEKKYRGASSVSMPISPTTLVEPESTTVSGRGSMVIAKYNDVDRDLGSTLSIEHILFTEPTTFSTLTTTINEHDDDNKSNTLIEYNGMENVADHYDEMEYQNDGPGNDEEHRNTNDELMGQMSVNFPESTKMRDKNRLATVGDSDDPVPSNHRPPSSHNKVYDRVVSEIEPEARAEIFELISSGTSAQRLEELLKSRNMSIDELISLRQRGSSRVHLADIPRLRSRSRKHKTRGDQVFAQTQNSETERSDLMITTASVDSNGEENSSPLSIYSTLDDFNEHANKINDTKRRFIVVDKTPIIIRISSRTGKDDKSVTNRKDPGELVDILSAFDSLPFTVYNNDPVTTSVESTTMTNNGETTMSQTIKYNSEEVTKQLDMTTDLGIGLVEEIARGTERNGEQLFSTTDESYTFIPTFNDEKKTLSKVRPSIIASGAILGMTIVGFLAIFIVCRIRQKQKYMYKNTFSKAVFQAPVMNPRKLSNSSSLNTIMVNVVATSTTKRAMKQETQEIEENFEVKSDIDNDSLDANDSWDTIPDFMK